MRSSRFLLTALFALVPAWLLAAPSNVGGRSIFLNGQNIDTVRAQTFENVTVEIDGNGNVHIRSDAYKVQAADPTPTPVASDPLAGFARGTRYWLISEENAPGMSQYDFDVFINGNLVKTVKSGEPQVIEDVTRFVLPGTNTVTITARKNFGSGRKSESKDYFQRVYIGKGALNDTGAILIENPDIDYRKTAADAQNFADQLTFTPK
jgi:hypothetical protein